MSLLSNIDPCEPVPPDAEKQLHQLEVAVQDLLSSSIAVIAVGPEAKGHANVEIESRQLWSLCCGLWVRA